MVTGSPAMASAGLALLSAVAWGGGDFAGGMGVKATSGSTLGALRLVAAAHAVSLAALLVCLWVWHAGWPGGAPLVWGLVAGVAAGLSLTAFYIALARGAMGASAAVSGLLAAAIPAAVSLWLEGAPTPLRLLGFALAGAAIWMIAAGPATTGPATAGRDVMGPVTAESGVLGESASPAKSGTMPLAIGGGVGFGVYFVALRFANSLGVLEPMALARVGSLATCLLLLALVRGRSSQGPKERPRFWLTGRAWAWALGVAVMDTGGNLLFIAATRAGRLDVAAVLASLYPASTILLAAAVLEEKPGRQQMLGMAVAVAAVVLITV